MRLDLARVEPYRRPAMEIQKRRLAALRKRLAKVGFSPSRFVHCYSLSIFSLGTFIVFFSWVVLVGLLFLAYTLARLL